MVIGKIKECIDNDQNFLLSGGAGSGKTYTLMQTLEAIFEKNSNAKVACITYTNVAANEILERSPYKNLTVSTIHDFLWSQIKTFQVNLKKAVFQLVKEEVISYSGEIDVLEEGLKNNNIEYREYKKLENGIISHDDVIKISNHLYKEHLLLCKITKDKYDYIFIDEYQDTQKEVIEVFLEFLQKTDKKCIIGFFGDVMQGIYGGRIGNINNYIDIGLVKEIKKDDNYRCSKAVIKHLNFIRSDIKQKAVNSNKKGTAIFVYSNEDEVDISRIKNCKLFSDWNFSKTDETKELYLTHKLIANQKGFSGLLNSALINDEITGDEPNRVIAHLLKIEEIITLYADKRYNDFIKKTYFRIRIQNDKTILKNKIETLKKSKNISISEVIELADKLDLIPIDDKIKTYISSHEEKYNSIKDIEFREIKNLYQYRENLSPYSTQHGVKGAEFNNVFVILDNGRWNQYNFIYLFEGTPGKESIIDRTKKIYYVSCSRTKDNLIVFFHKPSAKTINTAKEWFGDENVIEIDTKLQSKK